jgi:hypothetical protein
MCVYVTRYIQGGQHSLCRFQLEPPSKPLLHDNPMNNINGWFNASDENNKYIIPVELWFDEAWGSTMDAWYSIVNLFHDDSILIVGSFQVMKELPTYACYRFDISLFCLATKHEGKTQDNDESICWFHLIYDFT